MEPAIILKDRKNENGTRDFLVKWADGEEDTWVGHLSPTQATAVCRCAEVNAVMGHAAANLHWVQLVVFVS